ncbi:MAG: flagellar hook-associated protein FlgK [Bacteriovoracaceae bacterium]|nr:flagellar hook-associated protein FlgK [Bacteriovoracaceae bacterium]
MSGDLLSIANTGLTVSKKALETTGHNIANANTEGYSRQRATQQADRPILKGGLMHGTGSSIKRVSRVHDQFLQQRLNGDISKNENFKEKTLQLGQVEAIFNEIDSDGLNKILNRFYNAFRDLAAQPENETIRSVVRDNAALVAKDFHRVRETLDNISRNIDGKLTSQVKDINSLTKQIAKLNMKIVSYEAAAGESGDLRDQRDVMVQNLAKYFTLNVFHDKRGRYVVAAKGVGTLITGAGYQELSAGNTTKEDASNQMDGAVELYFTKRPGFTISPNFKKGKIAALMEIRNNVIVGLRNRIDEVAHQFLNTVNAVHRYGYVQREIGTDAFGEAVEYDSKGPTSGINFFKPLDDQENAAGLIELSDEIKADLSNITTALAPNSPGDNRIALGIAKLQHERVMADGQATIEEYFLQAVGGIGLEAGKAKFDVEQSEGILAQTNSIKERISGVSIDEETSNLLRFQHAYQASAKVMATAENLFQTVIGLKQ